VLYRRRVRVTVELLFPKAETHDKYGRRAGLAVIIGNPSAEQRLDAKKGKRVRRDVGALQLLGSSVGGIKDVRVSCTHHVHEDVVLLAIIEEFGKRKGGTAAVARSLHVVNLEDGDSVSVLVGKWVDQAVIDNAEDDGGRTNPQCERENGGRYWILPITRGMLWRSGFQRHLRPYQPQGHP